MFIRKRSGVKNTRPITCRHTVLVGNLLDETMLHVGHRRCLLKREEVRRGIRREIAVNGS